MENFKKVIEAHLSARAAEDELFAKVYAKEGKTIDECCRYILSEAQKRGNAVAMADDEVYGLAVHYYDEDNLEVPKSIGRARVSRDAAEPEPELSEAEKMAARERAKVRYEEDCLLKMKKAEADRRAKRAEAAREAAAAQLDLFG